MKMLSACLLLLPFISCTQVQDIKNDAVIEQKIETLLSSMTLEEKIGQMNQISSYGNIEDMSGLIKKGEVGSILNEVDPVRVNALQRVAMEESRLGIPLLMARDVIHGFKTIFPIPLGHRRSRRHADHAAHLRRAGEYRRPYRRLRTGFRTHRIMEPSIYKAPGPFVLETGHTLPELRIAYHTYGKPNAAHDNVVWVCHALTANSDVADWWPHTVDWLFLS